MRSPVSSREKMADAVERAMDEKEKQISVALIAKRNIPNKGKLSPEQIADAVLELTHVRLDREGITSVNNLDCLGPVTNLYPQQNRIELIENLEVLPRLRFLTLSGNKISAVKNLKFLSDLKFLDLSDNLIEDFDAAEFPPGLIILVLEGNPCATRSDYKKKIPRCLPGLKQLDGEEITVQDEQLAGSLSAESDSSDTEYEEEEDLDEGVRIRDLAESAANRGDLKQLCNDMIIRAKIRALKEEKEHDRRLEELSEIRAQAQSSNGVSRGFYSAKFPHR